jgi:hypothetical protein
MNSVKCQDRPEALTKVSSCDNMLTEKVYYTLQWQRQMSMENCEMMDDRRKLSYLEEYISSTILPNTIPQQTSLGLDLATI